MMEKPSVALPAGMIEEIEERRSKNSNRSEYIREALQARFDAEDAGEWETPDLGGGADADAEPSAPADD